MCKKIVMKEFTFKPNQDPCFDLGELNRGFNLTIGDSRPSYRQLWLMFAQNPNITAEEIISKITFKISHHVKEQHSSDCLSKEHIMKNGGLCPLSSLQIVLKEMNEEGLRDFLCFVTGGRLMTFTNFVDMVVQIQEESKPTGKFRQVFCNELIKDGEQEPAEQISYLVGAKDDYRDAAGRPGRALKASFVLPKSNIRNDA